MKTLHMSAPVRLLLAGLLFAGLTACERPQIDPNTDSLVNTPGLLKSLRKDTGNHALPRPGEFKWDSTMTGNPTDTILIIPVDRARIDPQPVQVFVR